MLLSTFLANSMAECCFWTFMDICLFSSRNAEFKGVDYINNYGFSEFKKHPRLSWGSCNVHLSRMPCFYKNVLKWEETKFKLPPRPRIKKLPNILSVEEVKSFKNWSFIFNRRIIKTKIFYNANIKSDISQRAIRKIVKVQQFKKADNRAILCGF